MFRDGSVADWVQGGAVGNDWERFRFFQSADGRRIMAERARMASMGSAKAGSAKLLITRRSSVQIRLPQPVENTQKLRFLSIFLLIFPFILSRKCLMLVAVSLSYCGDISAAKAKIRSARPSASRRRRRRRAQNPLQQSPNPLLCGRPGTGRGNLLGADRQGEQGGSLVAHGKFPKSPNFSLRIYFQKTTPDCQSGSNPVVTWLGS